MKKKTLFVAAVICLATMPTFAGWGTDSWGNVIQTIKGFYDQLSLQIGAVQQMYESAAIKTNTRLELLENNILQLTGGLAGDITELQTQAATWKDYSPADFVPASELDDAVSDSISRNSSIVKSSNIHNYLNDYVKRSTMDAELAKYVLTQDFQSYVESLQELTRQLSDKADKTTTDDHESRISALEMGDVAGGGCDSKCGASITAIAGWIGFDATAGDDGECVEVSNGTGFDTKDKWLGSHPFPWIGETPPDGTSFVPMWDDDGLPLFSASGDWLSDGLALSEDDADGLGGARIEVKVVETTPGTLAKNLDGTAKDDEQMANVVTLDENGHLRAAGIGTITVAADGTTIERSKEGNEEAPTLKVKTSGIVDGQTLQTSGRVAHVVPGALCDNTTIGTDGNGKLCVKKDAVSYTFPWDFGNGSFQNAKIMFGDKVVRATGTNIGNNTDNDYYVRVEVNGDTATAVVTTNPNKPSNGWAVYVGHVKNGVLTDGIKTTPAFLIYE